jgi:purine-nucleoside phosphorylase
MLHRILKAVDHIRNTVGFVPETGIIAGVGFDALVQEMKAVQTIPFIEIPGFPVPALGSDNGKLLFGILNDTPVVIMQGQFYFKDGCSMQDISFPVRVMGLLEIKRLLLTSSGAGLNPDFKVGDLMIVDDHIHLMGDNPLIGKNIDELGPRFPDMSAPYDPALINAAKSVAVDLNCNYHVGVYTAVSGTITEAQAEQEYLRFIGTDCIGVSIVPEVITARHMGLRVFAMTLISEISQREDLQPDPGTKLRDSLHKTEESLVQLLKQMVAA